MGRAHGPPSSLRYIGSDAVYASPHILAYYSRPAPECKGKMSRGIEAATKRQPGRAVHRPGRFYFADGWIRQRFGRGFSTGKGPIVLRQEISQLFHHQFLLASIWVSRLKVHGERLVIAGQHGGQLLKKCLFHGRFLHFLLFLILVCSCSLWIFLS